MIQTSIHQRGKTTPALSLTDRYPAIQKRIMNMTDVNSPSRRSRLSIGSLATLLTATIFISLPWSPELVVQASNPQIKNEAKSQADAIKPEVKRPQDKPESDSIGGTVLDENGKPQKAVKNAKSLLTLKTPNHDTKNRAQLSMTAIGVMKIGGIVVDQTNKPIEGATARVEIHYPKGDQTRRMETKRLDAQPTGQDGKWSIVGVPDNVTSIRFQLDHPNKVF